MDREIIPNHVAIIMDGNGRWAKKRNLPRSLGHKAGSENLKKLGLHIFKRGVRVLSVYAFSTENFKRSPEEIDYLMNLFVKNFKKELKVFAENNIRVVFSGRKEPLRSDVLEAMDEVVEATKENTGGIFNICLNYGSQYEIVDAVKRIVSEKKDVSELTPKEFEKYLYQELPPVDFLIRTSGEYRLSNFMMYQLAYAEFYFTDCLFPDFNDEKFDEALQDFQNRDRRFGGVKK
ncbi:MAG TPA: di-trans,poly-cis-decaprenylcistransferase [Candidatus Fimihabitans intestinipullorum]|uniref:Isoprenyl transferase n=1 Tax=Candidatus Fimihabitans intestinipullorum TaxID=2840820 RepID=A0A9D1HWP5_9BACT|nr:di-trans,poly-cis-decaprenylcistransferase [Candidatus Fimihabitans intestinipullorum]